MSVPYYVPEDIFEPLTLDNKKGYPTQLFVNPATLQDFTCSLCSFVCRSAVVLNCNEDHNGDDVSTFCEPCISTYLSTNGNKCPLNSSHKSVNFDPCVFVRRKIEQSKVYCPNGTLSSNLNKSIQGEVQSQSGSSTVSFSMEGYSSDTKESKEDSSQTTCRWTGTLKSLEEHLINCDYRSVSCHFHDIGCEHTIVQANTHLHNQCFVTKHLQLLKDDFLQFKQNSKASSSDEVHAKKGKK
ncbi:hypothetical protein RFI_22763 [Reticulomyxa filosa]|uniref:TRAF-type domain-containing protein n=1 Tax=Reticulomyxa filosa TaxID=46433 RepID=X6ML67_RETFI|nr:hypothetical protein RFI_22763 [Reticulomyxa filosa]|eukprot:ETO14609.1 hypothetical protein RFI_22763 [Reticulomyxa filosa]